MKRKMILVALSALIAVSAPIKAETTIDSSVTKELVEPIGEDTSLDEVDITPVDLMDDADESASGVETNGAGHESDLVESSPQKDLRKNAGLAQSL